MNWDIIQGKWKEVKGQAKEKWGKLTDDDFDISKANATNSSAACNRNTASPKTKPSGRSSSSKRPATAIEMGYRRQ